MGSTTEKVIIKADDRTKKAFASIKANLGGVAAAITALIGARAIGGFLKSTIDMGDEIQKLSSQIGASTEALSEYRHVADLSSVSFNVLTTAWQRQTRRISEATIGMGVAKGALEELGLSAEALKDLRPEQQFEIIAGELSKVASEGDRVRLAMQFWDTDGVRLLRIANQGAENIGKMRKEARELGLSLDQAAADDMAGFNDQMTMMNSQMRGLAIAFLDTGALEFFAGAVEAVTFTIKGLTTVTSIMVGELKKLAPDSDAERFNALKGRLDELVQELIDYGKISEEVGTAGITLWEAGVRPIEQIRDRIISVQEKLSLFNEEVEAQAQKLNQAKGETQGLTNETKNLGASIIDVNHILVGMTADLNEMDSAADQAFRARENEIKKIIEDTREPLEIFTFEIFRLNQFFQNGEISAETYARAIAGMKAEFEGVPESIEPARTALQDFETELQSIGNSIKQNLADTLAEVAIEGGKGKDVIEGMAKAIFKDLVSAVIKLGITKITQDRISDASASASTSQSVANAAVTADAWAAPAALTATASFGESAIIGAVMLAAIYALTRNMASFQEGVDVLGSTGPIFAHKGERVVKRATNEKLERALDRSSSGFGQSASQIKVVNNFIMEGSVITTEKALDDFVERIDDRVVASVQNAFHRRGADDDGPNPD